MAANLRDNFLHTQAQFPHNIQYNEINVYSNHSCAPFHQVHIRNPLCYLFIILLAAITAYQ